jgi:CRISPR type III-A-associated protein Csm2
MEDEAQAEPNQTAATEVAAEAAPPPKPEPPKPEPAKQEAAAPQRREDRPPRGDRKEARPPRPGGDRPGGDRPSGDRQGGDRPHDRNRGDRPGGDRDRREGGRPGGGRPFEGPPDIELEKLISDSLYLDNQAHAVVARMRDMDSGTKSQLRRLYNAVRRAVRAPESERQHQFVMLRARLAYTIARHSLRSLDALERLLLQVTRRNDAHGYERFKDLFEAIVAYNE